MNTKDFLRLVRLRFTSARQSVPLGEPTQGATHFVSKFILDGNVTSRFHREVTARLQKHQTNQH